MAFVGQTYDFPIRSSNKEPEWSNLCNNVLDQYLDQDDPFGVPGKVHERISSVDSYNFFRVSGSAEQDNRIDEISPGFSWDHVSVDATDGARYIEAKQPTAKEPEHFWANMLKALERNAAESEHTPQQARSAKLHPDFLSLGGFPSPPDIPASPTEQSLSVRRSRSSAPASGRRASQARSVSRGRPTGVAKSKNQSAMDPNGTIRKQSISPAKMTTPSRFRAGFRDMWTERTGRSPKKYDIQVLSRGRMGSPPSSRRLPREDDYEQVFATPPAPYSSLDDYNDQISPLTNNFQLARLHTPTASPGPMPPPRMQNPYFVPGARVFTPHVNATHTVPLNDTAPLFPERTSSLAQHQMQAFDFGFQEVDAWSAAALEGNTPRYPSSHYPTQNPYPGIGEHVVASIEPYQPHELPGSGLGINCDPGLVSNYDALSHNATLQYPLQHTIDPYRLIGQPTTIRTPRTPTRRYNSDLRSESRSPPLATPSRRSQSRPRRASRHRSAKLSSETATPRPRSQNVEKAGFVNYTPQDSGKILSGVAPSGSSKTKARREKEADDKRKRLSQAAVRAVVRAGGDLESLSEAGLI